MEIMVMLCYYIKIVELLDRREGLAPSAEIRRIKMADFMKTNVGKGIDVISVPASQFKTNEIALSLAMPLRKETAALNAIVPMLLCRSSKQYPSLTALNTKLASLYGAALEPFVTKVGEVQLIKLGLTCVDDRFSLDGEKISKECAELLLSLLFEPRLDENGCFYKEDIEREKRILTEKLDSEENEKRLYVLRKTEEAMFEGEPYAVNRYGSKEDVAAIDGAGVLSAWKKMLESAKVLLTVVGNADTAEISDMLKKRFADTKRRYSPLPESVFKPYVDSVKEITKRIDVKQGKLVMGFRVDVKPNDELTPAMRSFADIFGGGPYSRLFTKVREEMSLCYYCSARYVRQKSYIIVQCGCEEENMDKAVAQILAQLEEIKSGNFDYEFKSSKVSLTDAINSVYDAPESLENWYLVQTADSEFKSPKQSARENNAVTKRQIIECARLLSLDTVYRLVSTGEGKS